MERKSAGTKVNDSDIKLAPGVENLENRATAEEIAVESMTKSTKRTDNVTDSPK